jgi:PcfJ-like protein
LGGWCKFVEELYRRLIHHKILDQAGLPRQEYPIINRGVEQWSDDPARQAAQRRKYDVLKLSSLQIVNMLIRGALAVADQGALKLARRFPFSLRYPLYVAGATHTRNLQVIEAFPVLAVAIFGRLGVPRDEPCHSVEALDMILRGKSLRDIAKLMGVPWALKRVLPGAAREALYHGMAPIEASLIAAHLPRRTRDMQHWFLATLSAQHVSRDFVRWCARNGMSQGIEQLRDIGDWVRASAHANVAGGVRFIPRPFHPDMSVETVLKLSGEWHEAIAGEMSGPQYQFPPPWFPAQTIGAYELVPIDNTNDLWLEGKAMHHCVASYSEAALMGTLCICSIRQNGERVATVAFHIRGNEGPAIQQIRGPRNKGVPKIKKAISRWLRTQGKQNGHAVEIADNDLPPADAAE